MTGKPLYGYRGKILRVDLTGGALTTETLDEATLRKYVGGAALGARILYDEVPPGIDWSDARNRLILASGPLGGTRVGGGGSICVVTKGALTNGAACSQANGNAGTFLKFSGFDAIVVEGAAAQWTSLYIHDGVAELKDAGHLVGKDTFETEDIIRGELGKKEIETSVVSIGPAGENLVKFAIIAVDKGHVAGHNGVGAVMGSKKLKAIAIDRTKSAVPVKDKDTLSDLSKQIRERTINMPLYSGVYKEGSVGGVVRSRQAKILPVKNYTTSHFVIDEAKLGKYTAANIRPTFKSRRTPCYGCQFDHSTRLTIPEGKYAGREVDEPEYECMAAWSSQVGVTDVTTTIVLSNAVDRWGMDTNEAGWVIGWVLECYEKGLLTAEDTDGLEMNWGNGEAIMAMLDKIVRRDGFGAILAEGVKRAAEHVGGEAVNLAIYTQKGNTPRGHDHRVIWLELFDTCVSSTGTIETYGFAPYKQLGMPGVYDTFDPVAVSTVEAKIKGAMIFEDSLVTCRYNTATNIDLLVELVNAATGWDMTIEEAMGVGRRAVNLFRVFNLRGGIGGELDRPSVRYGSTPLDGPAAGWGIMPHWEKMLANYYQLMGWDEQGKPLPETLSSLGLEDAVTHLENL
ncbi:aldehyde ferredoxin oxidoreductase family protein [Chloroflexota bacterium]